MPGPGGGAHGGGGGRGGGGGGFHGGGGHHGGPGGPHGGGFHHRPPHHHYHHYYHRGSFFYGGGCLGGMFSMLLLPVILVLFSVVLIVSSVSSSLALVSQGGAVVYDENTFQSYAIDCYNEEFSSPSGFEDNLLIVFLTDEDCYDYYYIAIIGDDVVTDINYMFGNEYTEFGKAMQSAVNTSSYQFSLSANLAQVMETMTSKVSALGLESSFNCNETHEQTIAHLTNKSTLVMNQNTVNNALETFAETTGISTVVVVDEMENVFGKELPITAVFTLILGIGLMVLAIVLIVRAVRKRKNNGGSANSNGYNGGGGGYYGNDYYDDNQQYFG